MKNKYELDNILKQYYRGIHPDQPVRALDSEQDLQVLRQRKSRSHLSILSVIGVAAAILLSLTLYSELQDPPKTFYTAGLANNSENIKSEASYSGKVLISSLSDRPIKCDGSDYIRFPELTLNCLTDSEEVLKPVPPAIRKTEC